MSPSVRLLAGLHLIFMSPQVPLWIGVAGWSLFALSFVFPRLKARFPRFTTGFWIETLGGILALAVFARVRPVLGIESSAALIFLFLPLESLRMDTRRSHWRFIFLLLTSLAMILLDSEGWLATALMLVDLGIIFNLMAVFESGRLEVSWSGFRSTLTMMFMSLPLWIAIFLLFPRFTLELWGGGGEAQTEIGFSDELEPGRIEEVVQTSEVAFRFRWKKAPPAARFHYFRGSVLERGEGLSWRIDSRVPLRVLPPSGARGIEQEIWGHPRNGRALIALDRPVGVQVPGQQVESFEASMFRLKTAPRFPFTYKAWSATEPATTELSPQERQRLTAVSPALREGVRKAVAPALGSWESFAAIAAEEKVRALRRYFVESGFRYTLSPAPLETAGLVEFLNRTREGFCEHFAGATATILRASGVPARIIVGFLGGRPDPFTADWVVMTREAHAWVEYYDDENRAWRRLDPTLWIEPLRWEWGADVYWLPPELRERFALVGEQILPWWPQFQERMKLAWEASVGRSERWVLSYNTEWMRGLLAPVGAEKFTEAFSFLLFLGVLGVVMAMIPWLRAWWAPVDPWLAEWRRFGRRVGFRTEGRPAEASEWQVIEGALTGSRRGAAARFVGRYLRARYGAGDSRLTPSLRKELRDLVRDIPSETGGARWSSLRRIESDHPSRKSPSGHPR